MNKGLTIVIVLNTILSILILMSLRDSEKRIRDDIRMNTALIKLMPRTLPAVLYNPQDNKCVLVYPDSMSYVRPEWIKQ